jgi:hypothetical protein
MHKPRFSDPGVVGDLFGSALDLESTVRGQVRLRLYVVQVQLGKSSRLPWL